MKKVNPELVSEKAFEAVSAIMAPKSVTEGDDPQPELQPAPAQWGEW